MVIGDEAMSGSSECQVASNVVVVVAGIMAPAVVGRKLIVEFKFNRRGGGKEIN